MQLTEQATVPKKAGLRTDVHSGECVASADILMIVVSANIAYTPIFEGIMDKTYIADASCLFSHPIRLICATDKDWKGYASTCAVAFLFQ